MKNKLLQLADEIFLQLAKQKITPKDPSVKIAILIKETYSGIPKEGDDLDDFEEITPERKIPSMLQTAIDVYNSQGGLEREKTFSNACAFVAREKGIKESSVRAACCRKTGLKPFEWTEYFTHKNIRDRDRISTALMDVYPNLKDYIYENFK